MKDINKKGVYCIEIHGKKYIGSTCNSFRKRWYHHKSQLKYNTHFNRYMQNAYNKYGPNNTIYSIVEIVEDADKICEREQYYVEQMKPQFNVRTVARSNLGVKLSAEAKAKISKAKKGCYVSKETRKKIGEAGKGRIVTEETRKKISNSNKGMKNSEETRKKKSLCQVGSKNHRYGTKASEETRQRMRDSQKKGANNAYARQVLQIDENTNEVVKKWGSIGEASKGMSVSRSCIIESCRNRRQKRAAGYLWRYDEAIMQQSCNNPVTIESDNRSDKENSR